MSASAAQSLYSRDVLRLAMSLPHNDRLENAQGSSTSRAPICGSEMSVDVALDHEDRIARLAIRARACALGQASAAVVREKASGLDAAQIQNVRDGLETVLQGGDSSLGWPELEPFAYARDYPARHGAILLPFDALLAALREAKA